MNRTHRPSKLQHSTRTLAEDSHGGAAPDRWITPEEAAEITTFSVGTLANLRSQGKGPKFSKLRGKVVYRLSDVLSWIGEEIGGGKIPDDMKITARPRPDRKNTIQVDIMFPHPLITGKTFRTRLTAPEGLDVDGAKAWGRSQYQEILRTAFVNHGAEREATDKQETKKTKTNDVPTLGDLWIRYDRENDQKETSRLTVQRRWKKIAPMVKNIPCDAWTKTETKKLEALFKGKAPSYFNHACSLLRHLWKIAVEDETIDDVPNLPRHKLGKKKITMAHGQDEIVKLIEAARILSQDDQEPLEVLILLGIDGGLRPAEIAGIRWKDIDWGQNQLIVQNQRPLAGASDTSPKTGESGRVTMTKRLRLALEVHRQGGGLASSYVVTSRSGEALYTVTISQRVAKIHTVAGLPLKRGHFLRHCAASRIFAASSGNIAAAQAHLRHKHASTTLDYLHDLRGSEIARAAASFLDSFDTTVSPDATAML